MGGEGQRVPADEAALDGAFEPPDLVGILRRQMIPDQPGARGPHEGRIGRILGEEVLTRVDRLRNEALVVLRSHPRCVVGEADVEMGLEDQVDAAGAHTHPTVPRTTSRVAMVSVNDGWVGLRRRARISRTKACTRSMRSILTVVRL